MCATVRIVIGRTFLVTHGHRYAAAVAVIKAVSLLPATAAAAGAVYRHRRRKLSSAVAGCERENSSTVGRERRGRCCRRHAETAARVNRAVVAGGRGRAEEDGTISAAVGCTLRNRLTGVLSVATLKRL